jgi:hypothetical protein
MPQSIATNLLSDTHGDGMNVRGASTMSEDEGLGGAASESGGAIAFRRVVADKLGSGRVRGQRPPSVKVLGKVDVEVVRWVIVALGLSPANERTLRGKTADARGDGRSPGSGPTDGPSDRRCFGGRERATAKTF